MAKVLSSVWQSGEPLRIASPFDKQPKGPSRTKNTTESKFSTGTKFGTATAKWCGACSEMLVFF